MRNLYLTNRFFILLGIIIGILLLGFPFPILFPIGQTLFVLALLITIIDIILLYHQSVQIHCQRTTPKILSLSDKNEVKLLVQNGSNQKFKFEIIDEQPIQLQERNFLKKITLTAGTAHNINYEVRPLQRGAYHFGAINVFIETLILGLAQRRICFGEAGQMVPVYPSIIQMKQYELKAFHQIAHQTGIKRLRRLGHSYEFEQIKNYVQGDDYRSVNWKASSRQSSLMINQYTDEKSQQVYCIIDKSRVMKMPFDGLSLMDYAINSTLVMSNIILQKGDKTGLLTFSDKIGTLLKSESTSQQLNKILQALYNEQERQCEANYELLFHATRKLIKVRSLLLLYTNFESMYALERVLPLLRNINKFHLLVVIFFENTEVANVSRQDCATTEDIYYQTIAQKYMIEKVQIAQRLRQYGIQTILTKPEDLSINSINKYLELKSRGLI